jgi:hypothetical protein
MSKSLSPNLTQAVHGLYYVFESYKVRSHPEGCPCCVSDNDKRRLFSRPLGELTSDDLGRFAWKALTTWGTVEDLKGFLPRLLELLALDDCDTFDLEVLLGKLRLGRWQSWPETERVAVENFLTAIWGNSLAFESRCVPPDVLLCALGCSGSDLEPFLQTWAQCRLQAGYRHLVQFLDDNATQVVTERRLSNLFWSDAEIQMRQVIDWLESPNLVRDLERIFEEHAQADFSQELALAIDRLALLRIQ